MKPSLPILIVYSHNSVQMISIYLDWNVISQMKHGQHDELRKILDAKRFLMPYSTSHISDILSSLKSGEDQNEFVDSDLQALSDLSNNRVLLNDGKEVILDVRHPKLLFDDRVSEKDQFNDLSLENLEAILKENETIPGVTDAILAPLKNSRLDQAFVDAFKNPESAKYMDSMFPGLRENPTMAGFFKSFSEMMKRMNEGEDYKKLREITQSGLGINRDKMFNENGPFGAIEKMYKELNVDLRKFRPKNEHGRAWFNEISNEYLTLDMSGFQEDKINTSKGRKETFRNTTEDAFHAAFASTCNFYIINDNRAYHKTKKVFEKLNFNTFVFKPNEFVEHYKNFLAERPLKVQVQIPITYLTAKPLNEELGEDGSTKIYHLPYFVFDFFNKMIAFYSKEGAIEMILLTRFIPTNKPGTYFFEIERLSQLLFEAFGEDVDQLGPITANEFVGDEWKGRKRDFDTVALRFARTNGYFQLYYDINTSETASK